MSLAVTVLGSSAMYATAERAASGYLIQIDEFNLWVDAGGGSWRNLLSVMDYPDVDGVILTHRHPDHTIDIFQAFHARAYGEQDVVDIPLWAPQETIERVTHFCEEIVDAFELIRIEGGSTFDAGGAKVSCIEMAHPVETCGIRIEHEGAVLAYSADTGPTADLHSLASGADVFMCESTFQESDRPWWKGHMSAEQAGVAAADAGAGLLLLTHLPPGRDHERSLDEAVQVAGDVPVELADDLMRIEVKS